MSQPVYARSVPPFKLSAPRLCVCRRCMPVYRTAVGTPFDYLSGNTGLSDAFRVWGSIEVTNYDYHYISSDYGVLDLVQSATTCSPVVTMNPVQCRRSGSLSVSRNGINATADACSVSSPIYSVDRRQVLQHPLAYVQTMTRLAKQL